MSYTTDPDDPRLTHYTGPEAPTPQADVYLILSDEERAKGFVRPLRRTYRHVGPPGPLHPLRDLTAEEQERYDSYGYLKYEEYPEGSEERERALGRYWTGVQMEEVGAGCGCVTRMGLALCETSARDPHFYGATYCCSCEAHFPVSHFVWDEDGQRVGS